MKKAVPHGRAFLKINPLKYPLHTTPDASMKQAENPRKCKFFISA
jgi:hypothetical protein